MHTIGLVYGRTVGREAGEDHRGGVRRPPVVVRWALSVGHVGSIMTCYEFIKGSEKSATMRSEGGRRLSTKLLD